ncbi:MAG: GGDEF domain-containing protein [Burkholderiales bacterium]|nr:GGDEF domain-containing protein [Burkholderiales bacterium]
MKDALSRAALALAFPAAVLAATVLAAAYAPGLPASLAGLRLHGPWLALGVAAALAVAFNRGRAFFALAALAVAYAAFALGWIGALKTFPQRTVFAALALFVPAYFALLAWLRERGVFNGHGANRAILLAALAAFTGWLVVEQKTETTAWAYAPLWDLPWVPGPLPQIAAATIAASLAAILAALARSGSPIEAGLAAALAAFALGLARIAQPGAFPVFVAGAAAIMAVAVLKDTFRMAFRDELTGLASRRALNERLLTLGSRYAIAMVDVDHFKKFNDTHGHDVGDQVLRMVAARLARVGGGGRPFRYGGEEFTVLFPGARLEEALPHLEALRGEIERYRMQIRAPDRPAEQKNGRGRRGGGAPGRTVSVTVSIGVAERNERADTPESVIKAADKALYRAKQKGRNRVAR